MVWNDVTMNTANMLRFKCLKRHGFHLKSILKTSDLTSGREFVSSNSERHLIIL